MKIDENEKSDDLLKALEDINLAKKKTKSKIIIYF